MGRAIAKSGDRDPQGGFLRIRIIRQAKAGWGALGVQKDAKHLDTVRAEPSKAIRVGHGAVPVSGTLRISGMGMDAVAVATSSRCSRTALSISAMT